MPNIYNPHLLNIARLRIKSAFVDPATAGAGDPSAPGAAPPMAPAMAGMDPAMAGGMGPAAGAGPPPPDPAMEARLAALEQMASAGPAGGASGGVEPIKPKIDVNVEIMQIKKMLARVADALGVQIPAAEMTATSQDLTQMALQSENAAAGPAGGAPPASAIAPPAPIAAAAPQEAKQAGYAGQPIRPQDVLPAAKPASPTRGGLALANLLR